MDSSLNSEIQALSDDKLNYYIDLFQNRVETTRDYIDSEDDMDVVFVMRGKLQEYSSKLRLLKKELRRRSASSVTDNSPQQDNEDWFNSDKAYIIISLESRILTNEGEALYIKANPVNDSNPSFRHLEEVTGRKYFTYSMTDCDETVHFFIPFSKRNLTKFMAIAKSAENAEDYDSFWFPDMTCFSRSNIRNQETGEIMEVFMHKDFYMPTYAFIPVTKPVRATINGEKLFVITACKHKIGAPQEDAIAHFFVYAASEIETYISEIQEARKQNKSWIPDLSHFIKEKLTLSYTNRFTGEPGKEERDMYISRTLSYTNIMDNIKALPLL